VELIDPLTLAPLDIDALHRSVRKTGRLVLVEEAAGDATAVMGTAARLLADAGTFAAMQAPPQIVRGLPVPMPSAVEQEQAVLPSAGQLRAAIEQVLDGQRWRPK
jgi:pyruvate dehydrogenase E1 component beta subunit